MKKNQVMAAGPRAAPARLCAGFFFAPPPGQRLCRIFFRSGRAGRVMTCFLWRTAEKNLHGRDPAWAISSSATDVRQRRARVLPRQEARRPPPCQHDAGAHRDVADEQDPPAVLNVHLAGGATPDRPPSLAHPACHPRLTPLQASAAFPSKVTCEHGHFAVHRAFFSAGGRSGRSASPGSRSSSGRASAPARPCCC